MQMSVSKVVCCTATTALINQSIKTYPDFCLEKSNTLLNRPADGCVSSLSASEKRRSVVPRKLRAAWKRSGILSPPRKWAAAFVYRVGRIYVPTKLGPIIGILSCGLGLGPEQEVEPTGILSLPLGQCLLCISCLVISYQPRDFSRAHMWLPWSAPQILTCSNIYFLAEHAATNYCWLLAS